MIRHAAGLSRLHARRFTPATLAGIMPARFLLARFGGEGAGKDPGRVTWAVLGLGFLTGVPLLWMIVRKRAEKRPTTADKRA